jgi:predicted transcriptional regulator
VPTSTSETPDQIALVAEIVSAFVAHNSLPAAELPALMQAVHMALVRLASGAVTPIAPEPPTPAVPVRKSITPDYIVCLDDGGKFKSLRRHLTAHHGMTPDQYRAKWGLPADYPMVASNYSAERSKLAKQMGLGQIRGISAKPEIVKPKRGRPAKVKAEPSEA